MPGTASTAHRPPGRAGIGANGPSRGTNSAGNGAHGAPNGATAPDPARVGERPGRLSSAAPNSPPRPRSAPPPPPTRPPAWSPTSAPARPPPAPTAPPGTRPPARSPSTTPATSHPSRHTTPGHRRPPTRPASAGTPGHTAATRPPASPAPGSTACPARPGPASTPRSNRCPGNARSPACAPARPRPRPGHPRRGPQAPGRTAATSPAPPSSTTGSPRCAGPPASTRPPTRLPPPRTPIEEWRDLIRLLHTCEVNHLARRPTADLAAERRRLHTTLKTPPGAQPTGAVPGLATLQAHQPRIPAAQREAIPTGCPRRRTVRPQCRPLPARRAVIPAVRGRHSRWHDRRAAAGGAPSRHSPAHGHPGADRGDLRDRLGRVEAALDRQVAHAAFRAAAEPAEYLIGLLGPRPDGDEGTGWDAHTLEVERFRHRDLGLPTAPPPSPAPWNRCAEPSATAPPTRTSPQPTTNSGRHPRRSAPCRPCSRCKRCRAAPCHVTGVPDRVVPTPIAWPTSLSS